MLSGRMPTTERKYKTNSNEEEPTLQEIDSTENKEEKLEVIEGNLENNKEIHFQGIII